MIGLDINVLVRYVTQDDATQAETASRLIESLSPEQPGLVTVVSVVELVWVLSGCYQATRQELVTVLENLLRTKVLLVEHAEVVWRALRTFSATNADFADCLIASCAHAGGCEYTVTFDTKAAKSAGMKLLE